MDDLTPIAKFLIVAGILLVLVGGLLLLAPRIPYLGRLPGDVRYEGARMRLYVPIATCLLLSALLSLALYVIRKIKGG